MDEGKRPGGLTALAVLNFVFAGFNVLGLMVLVLVLVAVLTSTRDDSAPPPDQGAEAERHDESDPSGGQDEEEAERQAQADIWRATGGTWVLVVAVILTLAIIMLQLTSGVGYLKQSRLWGRWMGTTYGCVSIGSTIFSLAMQPKDLPGGGITLCALALDLYPLLTLILLNTTFKEDFIR